MKSIAPDTGVWISLPTSRNSKIKVVPDQENYPEIYDGWLTADEQLTRFSKSREHIVDRVKGSESPYVQGPKYYEEDLVVWKRDPIGLISHH